ncbi:hypothetical protein Cni_G26467 [Canna indica]|uniref:Uncharacterized protein n=1 Tax=Canna indica TaxID=4628 RepID=A0AAQ3KZI4_9LILI|nr:hypothetical protein Cni_G26467 [Canna indica]
MHGHLLFSISFLRMFKPHRRNDSGELDVFEAALYFSGQVNEVGLGLGRAWRAERRSLDAPIETALFHKPQKLVLVNQFKDPNKRHKQPSSPGVGKLVNFLSSFFNLTTSKKKSRSVNPTQSCKNVEYMERQTRRRRNSIGHHESVRGTERRCGLGVPLGDQRNQVPFCLQREVWHGSKVTDEVLIAQGGKACLRYSLSNRWSTRREEEEDGGESDSSSDLFELKSCSMGGSILGSSKGIPIYGTTNLEEIKRRTGNIVTTM